MSGLGGKHGVLLSLGRESPVSREDILHFSFKLMLLQIRLSKHTTLQRTFNLRPSPMSTCTGATHKKMSILGFPVVPGARQTSRAQLRRLRWHAHVPQLRGCSLLKSICWKSNLAREPPLTHVALAQQMDFSYLFSL